MNMTQIDVMDIKFCQIVAFNGFGSRISQHQLKLLLHLPLALVKRDFSRSSLVKRLFPRLAPVTHFPAPASVHFFPRILIGLYYTDAGADNKGSEYLGLGFYKEENDIDEWLSEIWHLAICLLH